MKKLLIALLMAAAVFAVAPRAEAGQFARIYTKHGVQYVHKSAVYNGCYNKHYKNSYRNYGYYPSYRHHHHRHVRSYPVYRSYYPRYYSSGYRCSSRPTFSIAFGF